MVGAIRSRNGSSRSKRQLITRAATERFNNHCSSRHRRYLIPRGTRMLVVPPLLAIADAVIEIGISRTYGIFSLAGGCSRERAKSATLTNNRAFNRYHPASQRVVTAADKATISRGSSSSRGANVHRMHSTHVTYTPRTARRYVHRRRQCCLY